jgi:hypothetical protein
LTYLSEIISLFKHHNESLFFFIISKRYVIYGNESSFPCNITYWAISYLPVSLLQRRKRRKSKEKGGRRDKYLQLQKEGGKANREEKTQQNQSRNIIPERVEKPIFLELL